MTAGRRRTPQTAAGRPRNCCPDSFSHPDRHKTTQFGSGCLITNRTKVSRASCCSLRHPAVIGRTSDGVFGSGQGQVVKRCKLPQRDLG